VVLRKLGEGGEIAKEKRQEMEAAGEWMGGLVKKEGGDHFIQRLVSKM